MMNICSFFIYLYTYDFLYLPHDTRALIGVENNSSFLIISSKNVFQKAH